MTKIFSILKLFFNLVLLCIYSFFAIILGNFLYGAFLSFIVGVEVPGATDPSHLKVAVISVIFVIILTVIFRKFFYLEVFSDELFENEKHKTKKEKMEIYVNKEIK